MDEKEYLTLEFDDGREEEVEILGVFECDGKDYIALAPDNGTEDVYLYGYKEKEDGDFDMTDIIDDAEFEKAAAEFDRLMEQD